MKKIIILMFFLKLNILANTNFENFYNDKNLKGSLWGIAISYVNGEKIFLKNENINLIPASALKVFTTANAFEVLRATNTLKTEISYSGKIKNYILEGNLIIKGYGDMSLGSENFNSSCDKVFQEIYSILLKNNIKKINGKILIDNSYFKANLNGSWPVEDIGNYYLSLPSPLSINDNSYSVYFNFKESKLNQIVKISHIYPNIKLKIKNEVILKENSGDNAYIFSLPWFNEIFIRGTIDESVKRIKGSMNNPAENFAYLLNNFLNSKNIKTKDSYEILNKEYKKDKKVIKVLNSPQIKEIINITNKKSFNFYAETLAILSAIKNNKTSLNNLKDFAQTFNINKNEISFYDACGLSRLNYLKALDFIKLLNGIYKKDYFKDFFESLAYPQDPILKGHISKIDKNKIMGKNLRIKTGSLKNIRAYVGYIKTKKGNLVSFSSLINNYSCSPSYIDSLNEKIFLYIYNNH